MLCIFGIFWDRFGPIGPLGRYSNSGDDALRAPTPAALFFSWTYSQMVYRNLFLDILNFEVHTGNFILHDVSQWNTGARLKKSAFNHNSILFAFVCTCTCTCTPYSTSKQDCSLDTDTLIHWYYSMTYFDTYILEYQSIGVLEYRSIGPVENRAACFRLAWHVDKMIHSYTFTNIYQILSRCPLVCHLCHTNFLQSNWSTGSFQWLKHAARHSSAGARSEPNGPDVAPGARL